MEGKIENINRIRSWYVIYTSPRAEKKVNGSLIEKGFETFCPLRKVLKQWSDRKKMVDVILFTSYVFVKACPADFKSIYEVRGFVRFVNYLGKPAIVRDVEIENIKFFLEEVSDSDIVFELDSQVRINSGPLKGESGIIERIGKHTVRIRIENLGMSLVAHVHKNKVETIKQ